MQGEEDTDGEEEEKQVSNCVSWKVPTGRDLCRHSSLGNRLKSLPQVTSDPRSLVQGPFAGGGAVGTWWPQQVELLTRVRTSVSMPADRGTQGCSLVSCNVAPGFQVEGQNSQMSVKDLYYLSTLNCFRVKSKNFNLYSGCCYSSFGILFSW